MLQTLNEILQLNPWSSICHTHLFQSSHLPPFSYAAYPESTNSVFPVYSTPLHHCLMLCLLCNLQQHINAFAFSTSVATKQCWICNATLCIGSTPDLRSPTSAELSTLPHNPLIWPTLVSSHIPRWQLYYSPFHSCHSHHDLPWISQEHSSLLGTCCSFALNTLPPGPWMAGNFLSFRSQFKCHCFEEASPIHPVYCCCLLPLLSHYPDLFSYFFNLCYMSEKVLFMLLKLFTS